MLNFVWFREDLRIHDHTALHQASLYPNAQIIGLYVIDSSMWHEHHTAACRVNFILEGLKELKLSLAKLNIPLLVSSVKNTAEIPTEIYKILTQHKAEALFFNKRYEFNEAKVDALVTEHLQAKNIECHRYDDQFILVPGSIHNKQGDYFKVFTAFKRRWMQAYLERGGVKVLLAPKR